jgi:hypothetical protein
MGAKRNQCRISVGKPEGKIQLGRPRHRWVDKWMLERYDGMVWSGLIWLRIGASGRLLWTR